ncbi:hypothetical protein ZHAS_00000381 [Anopheles sinensis]|uniref:Uncharacterized protein n=1 Tax=Anopheles sinensis TaxID=74873 RepID=A0A084VA50_ANOSI|nr:hypothetical protein ZHAS_00000381 [Anopheles sinensis]
MTQREFELEKRRFLIQRRELELERKELQVEKLKLALEKSRTDSQMWPAPRRSAEPNEGVTGPVDRGESSAMASTDHHLGGDDRRVNSAMADHSGGCNDRVKYGAMASTHQDGTMADVPQREEASHRYGA